MENKILLSNVGRDLYNVLYGVIETPCFPCKYYGGALNSDKDGYFPMNNSTHYFHKTVELAEEFALKELENLLKNQKELARDRYLRRFGAKIYG